MRNPARGNRVLVELQAGQPGEGTLICIPQAGAGATQFKEFVRPLAGRMSVLAACFPGRENRVLERPLLTIREMALALLEPIMDLDARRIVLFGHCSGALVAFELAHVLEARGFGGTVTLAVSAQTAPSAQPEQVDRPASELTLAELTEHMRALGGTPEPVLENEQIMELLAPGIRADFEAVERYSSPPGRNKLTMPILAVRGSEDGLVSEVDVRAWGGHTSGDFAIAELDGDHFYLAEQSEAVRCLLLGLLDLGVSRLSGAD